jgi:threonine synthase
MLLYSTKTKSLTANLEEAVFRSLPPDNGLYMPTAIPSVSKSLLDNINNLAFNEIAFEVSKTLLADDISDTDIRQIIEDAFSFDAPLVSLSDNTHVLEAHGLWRP